MRLRESPSYFLFKWWRKSSELSDTESTFLAYWNWLFRSGILYLQACYFVLSRYARNSGTIYNAPLLGSNSTDTCTPPIPRSILTCFVLVHYLSLDTDGPNEHFIISYLTIEFFFYSDVTSTLFYIISGLSKVECGVEI